MNDPRSDEGAAITLFSPAGSPKGGVGGGQGHGAPAAPEPVRPAPVPSLSETLELAREPRRRSDVTTDPGVDPYAVPGQETTPTTGKLAAATQPKADTHPTTDPAKKRPRPEVQAWNKEFSTEDARGQLDRGIASGRELVKQLHDEARAANAARAQGVPLPKGASGPHVPAQDGPIEMFPEPAMGVEALAPLPQAPQSRRPLPSAPPIPVGKIAAAVFAALVALVGGTAVWKAINKPTPSGPSPDLTAAEDEFVRKMRNKAEGAPDCWIGDDGFSFSYVGASGTRLSADRIGDVPPLYRRSADCVPD